MKIKGIVCKNCGDIIYSRAQHDFHWCSCKRIAIDGGFDYLKIMGNSKDYAIIEVEVDVTIELLYKDYNSRKDSYGIIKVKK